MEAACSASFLSDSGNAKELFLPMLSGLVDECENFGSKGNLFHI